MKSGLGDIIDRRARSIAFALSLMAAPAWADDIIITSATGSGFVVSGQAGQSDERLRVNADGPVFLPSLPSATNEENTVLCFDGASGELGRCDQSVLDSFEGPEGPPGPKGETGPPGDDGPIG